jgi:hypothetical protein
MTWIKKPPKCVVSPVNRYFNITRAETSPTLDKCGKQLLKKIDELNPERPYIRLINVIEANPPYTRLARNISAF